jgi:pseudouridine synthase
VKVVKRNKNNSVLEITIYEGKKRQIRRMFSHLGFPVLSLKRTQIGILSLDNLKSGHYRFLNKEEINQLKKFIENK